MAGFAHIADLQWNIGGKRFGNGSGQIMWRDAGFDQQRFGSGYSSLFGNIISVGHEQGICGAVGNSRTTPMKVKGTT